MNTMKRVISMSIIIVSYASVLDAQNYKRCEDYVPPIFNLTGGDTFYVDNTVIGSAKLGTEAEPWDSIQVAVDAMGPGDITFVGGGPYQQTNIIFRVSGTPTQPIVLVGDDMSEVIIDGSHETSGWHAGILIRSGVSNIFIENLTIENMHNHGIKAEVISSTGHENIVVRNVRAGHNGVNLPDGKAGHGILLEGVDGFTIDNVIAYGNHGDGISIAGEGKSTYSQDGYIINSVAYANDDSVKIGDNNGHGIAINQGRDIAICGCEAIENADHGFDVSDMPKGDSLSHHITLEGNIAGDNKNGGFAVNSQSHHVLYLNNLAVGNTHGFYGYASLGHIEYYHNVSAENKYEGFFVDTTQGFTSTIDDSIIFINNITFNNDTLGWSYPVWIQGSQFKVRSEYNNWQLYNLPRDTVALINYVGYTYSGTGTGLNALGSGHVSKDPGFTIFNDCLLATSTIDSGRVIKINGTTLDYCAPKPDMGICEYDTCGSFPKIAGTVEIKIPKTFKLSQNYPNPFNPITTIQYDLPVAGKISLIIYDVLGREVARLVDGEKPAGVHIAQWHGKNKSGQKAASGIYFYHMEAIFNDGQIFTKVRKLILMK